MPYLHLSVQSGDDMILKRMKRRHNRSQVLEFCKRAREIRPNMTFGADVIAGFPTETDEHFQNSLDLIHEAGIIFTHIFPYSKREGTPAAKMPQVNGVVVKKRARLLREAGHDELQKFLQRQVGELVRVVVEKDGVGRAENFLEVRILDEKVKSGDILEAKVSGVEGNYLIS
jgi:threonylcarbamoyladenosine tRNA methylthiotransferase MtaB